MSEGKFDARGARLRCNDQPVSSWPVCALLYELRVSELTPPWFADDRAGRLAKLEQVVEELRERGLDPESFVRLGLGERLVDAVRAGLAGAEACNLYAPKRLIRIPDAWLGLVNPGDAEAEQPSTSGGDPSARCASPSLPSDRFFDADTPYVRAEAVLPREFTQGLAPRIALVYRRLSTDAAAQHLLEWVNTAPLGHLLAWDVDRQSNPIPATAVPSAVVDQYQWMVDRFTITYFAQWRTSSLHLEWAWMAGDVAPPCAPALMDDRVAARDDLQAEIARRAVTASRSKPQPTRVSMGQITETALQLIEDGERDAAASLFRAVIAQDPASSDAHNNLGFCVLPNAPEDALVELRASRDLGYDNVALNIANQMQSLLLLGHNGAAVRLAEQVWSSWDRASISQCSFMWAWTDTGEAYLVLADDARPAVLALAAEASKRLGVDDFSRWRDRHDDKCSALCTSCSCDRVVPR